MNKKKFLSSVLAAALALGSTTVFAQGNDEGTVKNITEIAQTNESSENDANSESDFLWRVREDGSGAVLENYTGTDADVTIPSEVVIDGTVREVVEISSGAFGNSEVTSVYIPDGVKYIGSNTFSNCSNLKTVRLPDSVVELGESAFEGSGITDIVIPNGLTKISTDTFRDCKMLESVTFPDSIVEIGDFAFTDCAGLKSIEFPNNLKKIGRSAFLNCKGITDSVIIPDSVEEIGWYAFSGCKGIENVEIGQGVKDIGMYAFAWANLTSIKILSEKYEMPIDALAQCDSNGTLEHRNIKIQSCKGTAAETAAKRLGCTFTTLDGTESTDYSQVKGCTDVTTALYDIYSEYLTKYYVQEYPEMGLEPFYCSDDEHEFFKSLVKTIIETYPGENNAEKVYNWMCENIQSEKSVLEQTGFPMEVYKYKSADCFGNACLLCELLRAASIPAVSISVRAGDARTMSELSEYQVLTGEMFGHGYHQTAMFYEDGMWKIADSAQRNFLSDKSDIVNLYYICDIDYVAVKSEYYTPLIDGNERLIDNGKFVDMETSATDAYEECTQGCSRYLIPELVCYRWETGKDYMWLDGSGDVKGEFGEEGWVCNKNDSSLIYYLKKNGCFKTTYDIYKKDGKTFLFNGGFGYLDITDLGKDVTFYFGEPIFDIGDKFKFCYTNSRLNETVSESVVVISNYGSGLNKKVVEVEPDGTATVVGEGTVSGSVGLHALDHSRYKQAGLYVESNMDDSVTFVWDQLENVRKYVIKHYADGMWVDDVAVDGSKTSVEITGLNPETEYTFRIDAIGIFTVDETDIRTFRYETNDEITVTPGVKSETSFTYTDNDDGTVTITGGKVYDKEVTIPDEIDGKKVTGIADNAFDRAPVMKTVTIPETVVFIGENALGFNTSGDPILNFKMKGYEDSVAQAYAIRYDIPFELIGKASEENLPFKDENKKEEVVETDIDVSETVRPEDRITGITINPAFNMKNKDESGVGLDLTKIKVKAKEIYNKDGLKRAEEILGTELIANKHYNLLDLALVMDSENKETDISDKYAGLVEVTIPIPMGHRNKTFYCYRINEDGTKEIIPGIQTKDSYIVYLEHFSLYAFVADEPDETAPISVDIKITAPNGVDTLNRKVVISGDGINDKLVEIIDGKFDISGISDGDYKFTFSAKNCVPRAYNVTVANGAANGLDGGVKLYLLGDINGDGSIKMADVRLAFKATRNSSELTEYQFAVADASKDGSVKMADVRVIYKHTRGESLWK